MKIAPFIALALVVGIHTGKCGPILLSDDFGGTSLDLSKWQIILPTSSSSVTEIGGSVTTRGRGIIASQQVFASPYEISGTFTMLDDLEHFNVAFRTGLTSDGIDPYYERQGMLVSFSNDGDEISIQRYTSSVDCELLADTKYTLDTNRAYSFSIFDDGTNVKLAVDGTDLLSASSSYATGDHIALYSREFASTATSIDSVTVRSVPDGGPTAVMLALGLLAFGFLLPLHRISEVKGAT